MSGVATPLMQQYREIKARHQDAILFFRMGDFYEMFYDDAETASRALGLTLTSRNNGGASEVPLAGIPVKAAAEYLRRLVGQGHRVAICEQVEDPKLAKGIVKREVIETITPGAVFADDLLDGSRANYVCAVAMGRDTDSRASARDGAGDTVGLAAADLSTGELRLFVVSAADTPAVLARLAPRELLLVRNTAHPELDAALATVDQALVTEREGWEFDANLAGDELTRQFAVQSLEGFGLGPDDRAAIGAGGALLRYLRELQPGGLPHLARPIVERPGGVMPLDEMTRRNLELVESLRGGELAGTLLSVLDRTTTPMGQRLLRQWLLAPLLERHVIEARLEAVTVLVRDPVGRAALREALDGVRDVERLASKAAAGRATPRELRALGDSLARLPQVAKAVQAVLAHANQGGASGGVLADILHGWDDGADCAATLTRMLVARPPLMIGEEDTIAPGVDTDLDALRTLRDGGKDAIATIQQQERARTGIASLKVGYNKVFGYFLEISNANRHLVPSDYQRRQTLTGAERYVTPALKEYEEKVLSAAERIESRERELFEALRREAGAAIARWQDVARRVASIDVLASFAEVAEREHYVRPELHDGFDLEIVAGRHPVVERMMAREKFIPNDLRLTADAQLIVLTGPNMAGKSTILRQVGLIQLLAQVGAYVPARRATLPIVDRLFTRVGASDNLVRGQSTFMVEMSETSAILHTATKRSLVLLDEIGRGTSTYDGVSIAWSVSEHLHDAIGCKTVFATHYHELTQLASELGGVRNFTVAVREVGDQVLFLHQLVPGGADRSYGIEVGRLAGLPAPVIARAKEVLALLEGEGEQMAARLTADGMQAPTSTKRRGPRLKHQVHTDQLGFFGEAPVAAPDPALQQLAEAVDALEPEHMTPMQALTTLASLKDAMKGSAGRKVSM
ncbi:MAG: DNA mismatch repair protein MutS [Gemmatimonas sp.]|uniref:DNA mismatch repair protein MutS n=1 Tax=Gemmatimonas sp. TaxID=1962908 RepID=UPI00391FA5D2|nr:DNA mismatch repair protein MutS [Gemmatimonadota bacterium]